MDKPQYQPPEIRHVKAPPCKTILSVTGAIDLSEEEEVEKVMDKPQYQPPEIRHVKAPPLKPNSALRVPSSVGTLGG